MSPRVSSFALSGAKKRAKSVVRRCTRNFAGIILSVTHVSAEVAPLLRHMNNAVCEDQADTACCTLLRSNSLSYAGTAWRGQRTGEIASNASTSPDLFGGWKRCVPRAAFGVHKKLGEVSKCRSTSA